MPKPIGKAALFICLWLSVQPGCLASQIQNKVYKVGLEDLDFLPLFSTAENRDTPGVLIEVLDEFARQYDIEFEYIYLPIMRFASWYENDGIGFRVPDNAKWNANSERLIFSQPIVDVSAHTIVLAKNVDKPFESLRTIATLYGFTPSPQWAESLKNNTVSFEYDTSVRVLLRSLILGAVDGLDINMAVAEHYSSQLGLDPDQFSISTTVPSPDFGFRLSTQLHADIIEQFDEFLLLNEVMIKTKMSNAGLIQ